MNRYLLIDRMNVTFASLEEKLTLMQKLFSTFRLLAGRVYSLPYTAKGTEHDAIEQIPVTQHVGIEARDLGLAHFQRLFIHHYPESISSKAAIRLPGALCFSVHQDEYHQANQLIRDINSLKKELEQIITVESGLEPEQRFEFAHTHLRGLITLSAYRSLILLTNPASVRFGWANKHIIKNMTRAELLEKLEKSLKAERGLAPYSKEQWAALVEQEIDAVLSLPEHAKLKIKRPVKVQPIARVWYAEQQKQVQHPCPSPLLILSQQAHGGGVPIIGELNHYDAGNINHKHKPQAAPLRLLIPRLHLYTDIL
ncbi:DNA replication terminus site binding protein|uniref:DNA replication terminus site-binding protein n=1 Tax=Brenneria salicis ATCC 15712 = DSM 30166 TaxID=714314 RepID=A0A366HXC0_9GAMM|nr:DNA replication terminus site-binding protein [Brenneria salicis]NMN91680.1 DNA replication terminus site binding protein [Brenneria salicis ATCC 15712 = DSM 30166]RBP57475.1 DNA replication terminus site binding protein [Brenneria salicis ATCC 15712 = DSM 30166]RLM28565.1 DNA replication terminus site-binding protein [Brenneria salicis ATCC 15712 = DSM 30166]